MFDPMDHLAEKEGVLGGLGNDDGIVEFRQGFQIINVIDHMAVSVSIPHEADHFRVVPVANNDRGIAFLGMLANDGLNLDDPGPIEKEIREKVSAAKVGGGYIYHSDHSIPNTVSFKNYQRVIELVRRYGKY